METQQTPTEGISYPELIALLQEHFDVEQDKVETLFKGMYLEDMTGARDMKSGTWKFTPLEQQRAIISKSTGYNYLIGTDIIRQLDPASKTLTPKTILRVYKKWITKSRRRSLEV